MYMYKHAYDIYPQRKKLEDVALTDFIFVFPAIPPLSFYFTFIRLIEVPLKCTLQYTVHFHVCIEVLQMAAIVRR